jgi:hypothetical protein
MTLDAIRWLTFDMWLCFALITQSINTALAYSMPDLHGIFDGLLNKILKTSCFLCALKHQTAC